MVCGNEAQGGVPAMPALHRSTFTKPDRVSGDAQILAIVAKLVNTLPAVLSKHLAINGLCLNVSGRNSCFSDHDVI